MLFIFAILIGFFGFLLGFYTLIKGIIKQPLLIYISFIILGISFRQLVQTSFSLGWFDSYLYLLSPLGFFQFLMGPAVFLYLRSIIGLNKLTNKNFLLNWLPACIVFIDMLIGLILADKSTLIYEDFNSFQQNSPGLIKRIYLFYMFAVQNVIYIVCCFGLLIKGMNEGRLVGTQGRLVINWVVFLFFPMVILFSFFQINLNLNMPLELSNQQSITIRSIYLLVIIAFVVRLDGFKSTKSTTDLNSEIPYATPINFSIPKYALNEQLGWTDQPNSTNIIVAHALYNDEKNIRKLIHYIGEFVTLHKPFRKENYGVENLSIDLKIPQHHIRYIFKYYNTLGFVSFRNSYRLLDFMDQVKEKGLQSKTMESLALECGFGSHSSFLSAFKKQYGKNPNEAIYSTIID